MICDINIYRNDFTVIIKVSPENSTLYCLWNGFVTRGNIILQGYNLLSQDKLVKLRRKHLALFFSR